MTDIDNGDRDAGAEEQLEDEKSGGENEHERFRLLFGEKIIPEILRRGLASGMDAFLRSDRGVRKAVSDLRLRRELTNYFFHQIDETKNAALRVIAREVRDFLESTDLDGAIRNVLTSLAFEIRTEVRFLPTDDGSIRPSVKSTLVEAGRPAQRKARRKGSKRRTPARRGA